MVHLLPDRLLHPHPRAARATAEPLVPAPLHFDGLDLREGLEHPSRWIVDVVTSTQVTRVVVRDLRRERARRLDSVKRPELADEPGVMELGVVAPKLRVLVLERIE